MEVKYFDNAASTKISKEVIEEIQPYIEEEYGNPSSLYSIGRNSKKAIEKARKRVASLINCEPEEIIFTSGGSESDNTALKSTAFSLRNKGNHIITTKIEHSAILESCKTLERLGFRITYLNVDKDGIVDVEQLENEITTKTILISVMAANNEIGTIQPISQIAQIAKKHNILFHTDAVQAVGNMPIDVKEMGIDMLSMSGHKIFATKGIGALYIKNDVPYKSLIDGGHQEKGRRAGTENIIGIVALGKASEIAKKNLAQHIFALEQLRDYYISQVEKRIQNVRVNGTLKKRLPGNANISFYNVDAEALLLELDRKKICASNGSACSSGNPQPSHVLKAIGLEDEVANAALRVTFCEENTKQEVDYLLTNLVEIVEKLRKN